MKDDSKCHGCQDDFYNGHNQLGVKQCWLLKDAKIILRRRVGLWEPPPWKRKPERLPDCYNEKGFVFVSPKKD